MDKKVTGIVGYITWIGWLIAFFAGDREGAKFHLNQALVLFLCKVIGVFVTAIIARFIALFSILTLAIYVVALIFWVIGLIHAINEDETPLPLIGGITILK